MVGTKFPLIEAEITPLVERYDESLTVWSDEIYFSTLRLVTGTGTSKVGATPLIAYLLQVG
jgi:hypothetical protein